MIGLILKLMSTTRILTSFWSINIIVRIEYRWILIGLMLSHGIKLEHELGHEYSIWNIEWLLKYDLFDVYTAAPRE